MMTNESKYLSELEIIQRAQQERSKVVGEFISRLFSRHESEILPLNPIAAE